MAKSRRSRRDSLATRGLRSKNLSALLVAALNEPVYVRPDGSGVKITKREAIVTQMVNKPAQAGLRATKMLKEIRQGAGTCPLGSAKRKVVACAARSRP